MSGNLSLHNGLDEAQDDDIAAIYGTAESESKAAEDFLKREQDFSPWHHPVKQVVREKQWIALSTKLLNERQARPSVLRYFTLPGNDLFDIKMLTEACSPLGIRVDYFGFNSQLSMTEDVDLSKEKVGDLAPWVDAESALRQAGRITSDAIILPDRLEDIAQDHSHAAMQLRSRPPFDVINIDGCNHLAYAPPGRQRTTFDALSTLLQHQMGMKNPWLLFLTTRVDHALLGEPAIRFHKAISDNLSIPNSGFGAALADCLEAEEAKLMSDLSAAWNTRDTKFLKLYTVGLGKFLLQFFCAQPNLPANVELVSAYAYRVHDDNPDMLALAFRITPDAPRVFAPSVGGATIIPLLEPIRATRIADRAKRLWDIDEALSEDTIRAQAVAGAQNLMQGANYDLEKWREWLSKNERRPFYI